MHPTNISNENAGRHDSPGVPAILSAHEVQSCAASFYPNIALPAIPIGIGRSTRT
jgi:hypothetical protein